jgi:CheY-like chemotaxis protein
MPGVPPGRRLVPRLHVVRGVSASQTVPMPDRPRVLVIDDDRSVRQMFCDILTATGYAPQGVANGAEALAAFRPGAFDLVLTDYLMPGQNGLDVAAALRRLDARVPIILITGSQFDLEPRARALGVTVLAKPIDLDAFSQTVRAALATSKAAGCAVSAPAASPS